MVRRPEVEREEQIETDEGKEQAEADDAAISAFHGFLAANKTFHLKVHVVSSKHTLMPVARVILINPIFIIAMISPATRPGTRRQP